MSCEPAEVVRDASVLAHADQPMVIEATGLGKCYQLYDKPVHRMYQSLVGSRHRFYREFWALRGVDLQLRRGETLGIVGRNGAGKSTLLQLIAGTLKPTEGTVQRRGRVAALLELGSGFNPEFTGRQNVYLNASILGLSHREIDGRIDAILAYADIGDFVDQPMRNYSTGMVMRLAFAVIVHVDADVLVIDEALAVGDAFFMQKCMRYLHEFREHGSLLFVSHAGGIVASLCDRALWLDEGRMIRTGDVREVLDAYLDSHLADSRSGARVPVAERPPVQSEEYHIDPRRELMDRSTLRNDLRIAPFHPEAKGVGLLDAEVAHVAFLNPAGDVVSIVLGGECVTLRIRVDVRESLHGVVVGFYVKDRFGQYLFGDNTALSHGNGMDAVQGAVLEASFRFVMPRLPKGEYFLAVGVFQHDLGQEVIQDWLHEALRFSAEGGSMTTGMIGIPMLDIQLEHKRERA